MATLAESTQNLRRNLHEIADQQNLSARVGEYLDCYFVDVEFTGVRDASPEELLGAALQHFHLGQVRAEKQAATALYTPDFDRHGWHSPHTVIDIVTDDMPFLVDSITMVVYRHGLVIHRLLHPLLGVERHTATWRCRQPAGILDSPRDRSYRRCRAGRSTAKGDRRRPRRCAGGCRRWRGHAAAHA